MRSISGRIKQPPSRTNTEDEWRHCESGNEGVPGAEAGEDLRDSDGLIDDDQPE